MPKTLGQIHTVNNTKFNIADTSARHRVDLPGDLSEQLQKMVRAGNFFKLVGIDLTVNPSVTVQSGGRLAGYFRYYAPTRGRCAAYRNAFKAMANQMKIQGISMRDNALYDFRVALSNDGSGSINPLRNQATLDGTTGLAMNDTANPGADIFSVYNESVEPMFTQAASAQFKEGFDTLLQPSSGTDFVLNDDVMYRGNEHLANNQYEEIPFEVSWSDNAVTNFQWRPDPALYVAILGGQLEMVLDSFEADAGTTILNLDMNFMVAGWKSIMGNPDKKKRTSKKSSKKIRK